VPVAIRKAWVVSILLAQVLTVTESYAQGSSAIWLRCSVAMTKTDAFDRDDTAGSNFDKNHTYKKEDAGSSTKVYIYDMGQRQFWIYENGRPYPATDVDGFLMTPDEIRVEWSRDGDRNTSERYEERNETIRLPSLNLSYRDTEILRHSDSQEIITTSGQGACAHIDPITAESAAYDAALRARTSQQYRAYLAQFARGPHAAEVKGKLERCRSIQQVVTKQRRQRISAEESDRNCYEAVIQAQQDVPAECQRLSGNTNGVITNKNTTSRRDSGRECTATSVAICSWLQEESETAEQCP
jgi:hypothetical protein